MTDYDPPQPPWTNARKAVVAVVIVVVLGWAAKDRDEQSAPAITRSMTTVSADTDPPIDDTAASTSADPCAALGERVGTAAASASTDDAGDAIIELERILDEMRADATTAPGDVRAASEQVIQHYASLPGPGRDALAAAAASADEDVVALVDEMVLLSHQTILHPGVLIGVVELDAACPGLVDELVAGSVAPTADPTIRLRRIRDALDDLGAGGIMADYLDADWLDLTDRDMTVALSGLQDEYEDCASDLGALTPGDNTGCDALHEACDQRDLLACNDLYWSSVVGSEYETFGASCGGRTDFGRAGFAGYCEELE